jgi:hypothetical protein
MLALKPHGEAKILHVNMPTLHVDNKIILREGEMLEERMGPHKSSERWKRPRKMLERFGRPRRTMVPKDIGRTREARRAMKMMVLKVTGQATEAKRSKKQ